MKVFLVKKLRQLFSVTLVAVLLLLNTQVVLFAKEEETEGNILPSASESFESYKNQYGSIGFAESDIILNENSVSSFTGVREECEGKPAFVLQEGDSIEFSTEIAKEAKYSLELTYCTLKGRGTDMVVSVWLDGSQPYEELNDITINRLWANKTEITRDNNDNDICPEQTEVFGWSTINLKSFTGYSDDNIFLVLHSGTNKIKIKAENESIAISGLRLVAQKEAVSYNEYKQSHSSVDSKLTANELEIIEAEKASIKSHAMIYPTSDTSSPGTSPSDPIKIRLNTLGQSNWRYSGQWVTWNVKAPKAGFYRISLKYRQNFLRGMSTARSLKINGELPFKEAETVYFPYNSGFEMKTISDAKGEPYLFYLNEGDNTITLEVVIGSISEILTKANSVVSDLNTMYRRIIMITGTSPDTFRDYYLDRDLPDMLGLFEKSANTLKECTKQLEKDSYRGSEAVFFEEVARMLENFIEEPDLIPKQLASYKNNISSLASMILGFKEQPLELDYIVISGTDAKLPKTKVGFFKTISFKIAAFLGSFFEDYNAVGNTGTTDGDNKTINVWANAELTGRDQLAILKRLIDNDFTVKNSINVDVSLVQDTTILTQAILAGTGPDVATFIAEFVPINFSMREALADLSKFDGFSEITEWFYPNAFTPYEYNGGIYALPETQIFNMLFYRTDVFEELKLEPPATWDEFLVVSSVLQKSNLEIGIPECVDYGGRSNAMMFETLVLQNGGKYYNDKNTKTCFDSNSALKAFLQWTSFYKDYSYPYAFDPYSRFRTGEMPLVIMPISFFNTISVASPEIKGKWSMAPIPGVRGADGSINNSQSSMGNCCMMTAKAKNKEECFAFMKWWVGAETQSNFGNQLEMQLGIGARYYTANKEAFSALPWNTAEQKVILSQWEKNVDVPIVPGDYYVTRNLLNAFRRTVYYSENAREVLNRYNNTINKEITRKREEYGLPIE